ncbi:MAG: hypothetical protein OEZ68_09245 [Gammaproteobacteria bacterium]|nr:hypothetical protein [Gammaproteobacteria bacterium]MDH5800973.1 hypothetical protein [Gammaproteobacteria bacterium]
MSLSARKQNIFRSGILRSYFNVRVVGFALLVLSLLVVFVVYYAKLSLKNNKLAKEPWEYTFLINDIMRQLPTLNPVENSKQYFYRLVYSQTLAQNVMSYHSRATATEIISYYQLYFNASNYLSRYAPGAEHAVSFRGLGNGFDVYVKEYETYRHVFIEYFP